MGYTRSSIKTGPLFEDGNIKMQDLIRLSSASCGGFLHQTVHFADSTCLAVNRFRGFIPLNHLNTVNLFQLMNDLGPAMTESEVPKSRRRFCRSGFSRLN